MHILTRSLAAAAFAVAYIAVVPAANAQTPAPTPGPSQASPNIPEPKLAAAAAALERVTAVHQDYRQRIASAEPAERKRIADEATDALKKAVTDQGISVEEYSSIIDTAQKDPDLRTKLLQRVRPQGQ
jgi:hypothetical protein